MAESPAQAMEDADMDQIFVPRNWTEDVPVPFWFLDVFGFELRPRKSLWNYQKVAMSHFSAAGSNFEALDILWLMKLEVAVPLGPRCNTLPICRGSSSLTATRLNKRKKFQKAAVR